MTSCVAHTWKCTHQATAIDVKALEITAVYNEGDYVLVPNTDIHGLWEPAVISSTIAPPVNPFSLTVSLLERQFEVIVKRSGKKIHSCLLTSAAGDVGMHPLSAYNMRNRHGTVRPTTSMTKRNRSQLGLPEPGNLWPAATASSVRRLIENTASL